MKLLAVVVVALLALGGCSAAPAHSTLKESCDKLIPLSAEYGQVMPTTERYAAYLPKFQAVSDAGDQATKDAMAPMLAAMSKGAAGDQSAMMENIGATITLVGKCQAAGSDYGKVATASATPADPSPSPTSTLLDTKDFKAVLDEQGRECTGKACVVKVRVAVGYVEADDLTKPTTVTYGVWGGTEPVSRTVTLDEDGFAVEEFSVAAEKGSDKLYAMISQVEQQL